MSYDVDFDPFNKLIVGLPEGDRKAVKIAAAVTIDEPTSKS